MEGPTLGSGNGEIFHCQFSVGDRAAPIGVNAMNQLDGIAVAGIFNRAIVKSEAIPLVDLEHCVAAAGEGVSPQVQLFAADLVGHHQRAVAHVLVAQERHDGIRDRGIVC